MGKSITKLVIAILVIALGASIALFGFNIQLGGWHISYPNALDEEQGIRQGLDLVGGSVITYEAQAESATDSEMETVKNVLRKRLDTLGYNEATVTRQGEKKVRVEIPAIQDPEEAVQTLGQTAKLTFRDADGNVVLEGTDVASATAAFGQVSETGGDQHYVQLKLNDSGVAKFAEATAAAAAKADGTNYISIMLDEKEISRPSVSQTINSNTCVISGGFADRSETHELASLINSGNLPFSIKDVELRSVGPTLGEKALETSLFAAAIGILLILVFMVVCYRLPGLMADIALVAYIAIVTFIMSFFRINLSLPGIAGIILSVGMAVDANVIIFARMKEELSLGKTVKTAVDSGFNRAFIAILDANVTTMIAAVVLYYFGTGPIQGFAITLAIGTLVSMFTAIVITKFLLRQLVGLKIKNMSLFGVKKRGIENA
ncbi:MAG: protein translocase subunit SecD [Ruminococcaceae bacterium]|nr:protein translocase subunit SecD [Oscillospiraceae bacterium]